MDEQQFEQHLLELAEKAKRLPLSGGGQAFRMHVADRDWEAVQANIHLQRDRLHGAPTLSGADWEYIRKQAAKDGVVIE